MTQHPGMMQQEGPGEPDTRLQAELSITRQAGPCSQACSLLP